VAEDLTTAELENIVFGDQSVQNVDPAWYDPEGFWRPVAGAGGDPQLRFRQKGAAWYDVRLHDITRDVANTMVHDRERGHKAEYLTIVQEGQMRQLVGKLKETATTTHREGAWKANFRGRTAENISRKFVSLLRHSKMPRGSDHAARMDSGGWVNLSSITTAMWMYLNED